MSAVPRSPLAPAPSRFDVAAARAEFPALAQRVHGHPLVYLDSAATAQKPRQVLEALHRFYAEDCANVHRSVHRLSERATAAYEGARGKVRNFLNARSEREIVFTRGTTDAINLVAAAWGGRLRPGDEILITAMEHHSNIVPWQLISERTGARLVVAPINDRGELVWEEFERRLSGRTRIVAFDHISNALGTVNPAARMVARAHAVGALALIDGAQSAPHLPIDVQALDCDFFAFSGHKLFGPTGIGVLYGKAELLEAMSPYQGGGDMIRSVTFEKTEYNEIPYKFEAGTPHIAGAIGLGAAIDFLEAADREAIAAYERELTAYALQALAGLPGLRLIGTAAERAGVFSFVLAGVHPHDAGTILDAQGIAVRAGHHCAQPVMERFGVPATTRASLALYNTREEIDALVRGVEKVRALLGP